MSDHDEQRRAMRRELRERRSALSPEEQAGVSAAVERRLAQIAALRRSPVVGGYRAIRGEVDIDAALTSLHAGGTLVTVPRVSGDRMDFLPWTSVSETITGSFGIDEPINGEPVQSPRDVQEAVRDADGDSLEIAFMRDRQEQQVSVPLADEEVQEDDPDGPEDAPFPPDSL